MRITLKALVSILLILGPIISTVALLPTTRSQSLTTITSLEFRATQTTITLASEEMTGGVGATYLARPLGSYEESTIVVIHYQISANVDLGRVSIEIHGPAPSNTITANLTGIYGSMVYSNDCDNPTVLVRCEDTVALSLGAGSYFIIFSWQNNQKSAHIKVAVYQVRSWIYSTKTEKHVVTPTLILSSVATEGNTQQPSSGTNAALTAVVVGIVVLTLLGYSIVSKKRSFKRGTGAHQAHSRSLEARKGRKM